MIPTKQEALIELADHMVAFHIEGFVVLYERDTPTDNGVIRMCLRYCSDKERAAWNEEYGPEDSWETILKDYPQVVAALSL